jgi:hypothetical protein
VRVRRVDFMKLTGLTREVFDSRARRMQFPFSNTDVGDRSYRVWEAYLTLIADDLSEKCGMYLTDACSLASTLSGELQRRWPNIVTTSQSPGADIFCGRLDLPFSEGRGGQPPPSWKGVVGTLPQIVREVGKSSIIRVALTNASRLAAVLHSRAVNANLDLADFWKTP